MAKAVIGSVLLLILFVLIVVPVSKSRAGDVPIMSFNTGIAGYGANDSGWLYDLMWDIEFDKPKPIQQFFRQTHFEVKSKQSIEPVSSNLLLAVDDTFNNPLLTLRVNFVSNPSLLSLMLLGFICLLRSR